MSNNQKIIPLGNYVERPINEVCPTKEIAEQRIIRDLAVRYRKLRKGKRVCQPPPPNGGDAA